MPIKFRCPCQRILRVPDTAAGKKARCPFCDRVLRVPVPGVALAGTEPSASETSLDESPLGLKLEAPVAEKAEESKPSPVEKSEEPKPSAPPKEEIKGRIVLGESNPADLERARRMLEEHGYLVITARDGEEVIRLARENPPDLIMVDVRLDKLSGFKVVETLSDPLNEMNKNVWQTPFIMTTPKMRGRDKQYAISLKVSAFLQKPFAPADLCPRIEKAIRARRDR